MSYSEGSLIEESVGFLNRSESKKGKESKNLDDLEDSKGSDRSILQIYLKEVGKFDLLNKKEEIELAQRKD